MQNIDLIVKHLAIDSRIQQLMSKSVKLPAYLDDLNSLTDHWHPHPPCLIPLFLGYGASYKGVINHFFCDRKNTYAEYFLEQGYLSEIARDANQLITLIVLKMIITKDELTTEIIQFCKQLNFHHYNEVEQFAFEWGDDPQEFDKLVFFNQKRPFKYFRNFDDYNGDFPSSLCVLNNNNVIQNSSMFEIAVSEQLNSMPDLPPWLNDNTDKKSLFGVFVANNQLREAWFTLNAKGWLLKDVAEALEQLKEKTEHELFPLVADNWIDGWKNSSYVNGNY
jgi:hypothetical protein